MGALRLIAGGSSSLFESAGRPPHTFPNNTWSRFIKLFRLLLNVGSVGFKRWLGDRTPSQQVNARSTGGYGHRVCINRQSEVCACSNPQRILSPLVSASCCCRFLWKGRNLLCKWQLFSQPNTTWGHVLDGACVSQREMHSQRLLRLSN